LYDSHFISLLSNILQGLTATYHFLLDIRVKYDIVVVCLTVNQIS